MTIQELFRVNKFITLKLENDKTFIYINNERFSQCLNLVTYYETSAKQNIQVEMIFKDITLAILKTTQKI